MACLQENYLHWTYSGRLLGKFTDDTTLPCSLNEELKYCVFILLPCTVKFINQI